jgi:hypothetical protein
VQKVKLHRTIIVVAAVALGAVSLATDALARGGGGGGGQVSSGLRGGHIGGGLGVARTGRAGLGRMHVGGGAFAADHSGGGMGSDHLGHQQHAHGRRHDRFGFGGFGGYGYGYENGCLDNYDAGCFDHPTNEDAAVPGPVDPTAIHRSGCRTQTQKVPSEDGGERTVNIVRC